MKGNALGIEIKNIQNEENIIRGSIRHGDAETQNALRKAFHADFYILFCCINFIGFPF